MNNESLMALAQGFLDGGCKYAANFPGFYSHELFALVSKNSIAPNEKIAYEMAYGACLGGARSLVCLKSFGLNVASDAFLNSIATGVHAGLVVVVTEDIDMEGSQLRQDSRPFRDFFGGLWLEPCSVSEAYDMAYAAFDWSETLDIPIVIRLTNQFFNLSGCYQKKPLRIFKNKPFDASGKFINHPVYWHLHQQNMQIKQVKINKFVERYFKKNHTNVNSDKNYKKGIIVLGNCYRELTPYLTLDYEILSINTYPLPTSVIKQFMKNKTEIKVFEQGNSYAADLIKKIVVEDNHSITISNHIGHSAISPSSYRTWSKLEKLFSALKAVQPSFVVSDLTQFTSESTHTIQACLCLGACIGTGIGLAEVGVKYPFCISGDASLLHTGVRVIEEALARKASLGIIIIDNGGSWCTGGQMTKSGLNLEGLPIKKINVSYEQTTQREFYDLLHTMQRAGETSILRVYT
jgi:indolepyruvate ferredoxin oxidoreductase alpha subunit